MLQKFCVDCGEAFEVDEDKAWATRCYPCWQDWSDRQGKRRVEQLTQQVEYWKAKAGGDDSKVRELEAEVARYRKQTAKLQREVSRLELLLITEQAKGAPPRYNGQGIPPDMLRRLIQLVHPDKHGGSEAATKATQWLLEQRD